MDDTASGDSSRLAARLEGRYVAVVGGRKTLVAAPVALSVVPLRWDALQPEWDAGCVPFASHMGARGRRLRRKSAGSFAP
jgi:hypothetical protein